MQSIRISVNLNFSHNASLSRLQITKRKAESVLVNLRRVFFCDLLTHKNQFSYAESFRLGVHHISKTLNFSKNCQRLVQIDPKMFSIAKCYQFFRMACLKFEINLYQGFGGYVQNTPTTASWAQWVIFPKKNLPRKLFWVSNSSKSVLAFYGRFDLTQYLNNSFDRKFDGIIGSQARWWRTWNP